MPKTIYLANPCGFSAQQKAELLEALGVEVWEPFARNNQDFANRVGLSHRWTVGPAGTAGCQRIRRSRSDNRYQCDDWIGRHRYHPLELLNASCGAKCVSDAGR